MALGDEELEELAERREPSRLRGCGKPALGERREIAADIAPAEAAASRPQTPRGNRRGRGDRRRAC